MKDKIPDCISDTSTIIRLTKGNADHCFHGLFEAVHIPQAVVDECKDANSRQTITREVFRLAQVGKILSIPTIQRGEIEVISLAVERGIKCVLMDDYAAFRKAKEYGLSPLKSFDLLVLAKKKGLIKSVRNVMDTIQANNDGIDPIQYEKTLLKAGE